MGPKNKQGSGEKRPFSATKDSYGTSKSASSAQGDSSKEMQNLDELFENDDDLSSDESSFGDADDLSSMSSRLDSEMKSLNSSQAGASDVDKYANTLEKAKAKNREHAKNTRNRKKSYIESLKQKIQDVSDEREKVDQDRRVSLSRLVEKHQVRRQVLNSFFQLRVSGDEITRDVVQRLCENDFKLTLPVTPYRSFPPSESLQGQRHIQGIDATMSDLASIRMLLRTITKRDYGKLPVEMHVNASDLIFLGDCAMGTWEFKVYPDLYLSSENNNNNSVNNSSNNNNNNINNNNNNHKNIDNNNNNNHNHNNNNNNIDNNREQSHSSEINNITDDNHSYIDNLADDMTCLHPMASARNASSSSNNSNNNSNDNISPILSVNGMLIAHFSDCHRLKSLVISYDVMQLMQSLRRVSGKTEFHVIPNSFSVAQEESSDCRIIVNTQLNIIHYNQNWLETFGSNIILSGSNYNKNYLYLEDSIISIFDAMGLNGDLDKMERVRKAAFQVIQCRRPVAIALPYRSIEGFVDVMCRMFPLYANNSVTHLLCSMEISDLSNCNFMHPDCFLGEVSEFPKVNNHDLSVSMESISNSDKESRFSSATSMETRSTEHDGHLHEKTNNNNINSNSNNSSNNNIDNSINSNDIKKENIRTNTFVFNV